MKYITYTLTGSDIKDNISRRYSDFFALREQLKANWPGIFIPGLPPKQAIGNTDKDFIKKRARLINKFCFKLTKYPFLYETEEVKYFQTVLKDFSVFIAKQPKWPISVILEHFKETFTDYPENYDIILGKSKMKEYEAFLRKTSMNLKTFSECLQNCVQKRETELTELMTMLKEMEEYENVVLREYADNNEEKLIFANTKNTASKEKADQVEKILNNPYVTLEEWIDGEILDVEAGIEAFESLNNISQRVDKMNQKIESLDAEIKQLQYGNQGFFSGLFKTKEAQQAELETEKMRTEEEMQGLFLINKMAHYRMQEFFTEFQKEKTETYYKALKTYALLQRDNSLYTDELWGEVKNYLSTIKIV
ncbi:MAG: hypothetical protein MJ252_23895 [archaeon]|nr:hypothetical protein [archaeon]